MERFIVNLCIACQTLVLCTEIVFRISFWLLVSICIDDPYSLQPPYIEMLSHTLWKLINFKSVNLRNNFLPIFWPQPQTLLSISVDFNLRFEPFCASQTLSQCPVALFQWAFLSIQYSKNSNSTFLDNAREKIVATLKRYQDTLIISSLGSETIPKFHIFRDSVTNFLGKIKKFKMQLILINLNWLFENNAMLKPHTNYKHYPLEQISNHTPYNLIILQLF